MSDIVIDAEIQVPTHVTLKYDVEVPFVTLVTQADWNESDSSKKGYIKNKPDLKPVATSGDYDDLDNKPTIPVVPTNVSVFTNDAGYITKNVDDLINYTKTTNLAEVAISGDYYDLINTPTIPAAQIQSDWTQSDNTKKDFIKNKPSLATVATTGSYTDLTNKPTKLSDFTNDEGFIDNTINNLTNYYTKSDTYTKLEVNNLIHNIISLDIEIVLVLPTSDISTTTIYLVPNTTQTTGNIYDEYIYVNNAWELIGSTQVDLSNYYTKTEVDTALSGKQDTIDSSHKLPASNVSGLANVATSGSYNDLSSTPTIPTNTSDLTNNGSDGTSTYVEASDLATVAISGSYNDLSNKPTIPDAVSVTQIETSGTKIATITVGSTGTDIYAPSGGGLQNLVDGSATGSVRSVNANPTIGQNSISVGGWTTASGDVSQAFGSGTTASGQCSHAEGSGTTASGIQAHAEGGGSVASGWNSHAEGGGTVASGTQSHAEGGGTIANHKSQHVFGEYNVADTNVAAADQRGDFIEVIGNGTDNNNRSNARTLDWQGNEVLAGGLKINGTQDVAVINPATSAATTLVAGKLNTLGSVDYATIALPATPGTAEYNGTFTSTTSGNITVSLPLTYWQGDTDIVAGKTYSFSIQNGVGFIIQLD